eukprot:scaffold147433_cov31-Prasinocladus_malaysianus.AAC.1
MPERIRDLPQGVWRLGIAATVGVSGRYPGPLGVCGHHGQPSREVLPPRHGGFAEVACVAAGGRGDEAGAPAGLRGLLAVAAHHDLGGQAHHPGPGRLHRRHWQRRRGRGRPIIFYKQDRYPTLRQQLGKSNRFLALGEGIISGEAELSRSIIS